MTTTICLTALFPVAVLALCGVGTVLILLFRVGED